MTFYMVSLSHKAKKDFKMSPKHSLKQLHNCSLKITRKRKKKPNIMFNWLLMFQQETVISRGDGCIVCSLSGEIKCLLCVFEGKTRDTCGSKKSQDKAIPRDSLSGGGAL